MSFSWYCLNVAFILASSHRNPVQRYKKYLRFTSVFQIILVTKARMHFLPLRLKVGPSLRTPSPCPTDQESAHVGKIAKNRQRKLKFTLPNWGGKGWGRGVEPREGLREGSKLPLPHNEPSIYGPSSPIEGEREGKNDSQLILGLDIQTVNLNPKRSRLRKQKSPRREGST